MAHARRRSRGLRASRAPASRRRTPASATWWHRRRRPSSRCVRDASPGRARRTARRRARRRGRRAAGVFQEHQAGDGLPARRRGAAGRRAARMRRCCTPLRRRQGPLRFGASIAAPAGASAPRPRGRPRSEPPPDTNDAVGHTHRVRRRRCMPTSVIESERRTFHHTSVGASDRPWRWRVTAQSRRAMQVAWESTERKDLPDRRTTQAFRNLDARAAAMRGACPSALAGRWLARSGGKTRCPRCMRDGSRMCCSPPAAWHWVRRAAPSVKLPIVFSRQPPIR